MATSPQLPRKPEARTEKVEELVQLVRSGKIRVPWFQRGLKWKKDHVADLFDSIYRGFPIGSLLFYKRPAEIATLEVGPLKLEVPEQPEAWWVVDGQQRVTTLAAALARPLPLPDRPSAQDPYVLFFDAQSQEFKAPPISGEIPGAWVPLPVLLDGARLTEWVFGWEKGSDEAFRRVVFEAGARIREYSVPLYLLDSAGSQVAEEIYYRTNQTGVPLKWTEVHKALFGGKDLEAPPTTLEALATELTKVGMGQIEEERLLTCLLALRAKDPTRTFPEHYRRDPEFLRDAVHEALPVLRRGLSFLREDAGIPHLRLLPQSIVLDILTRFFAVHPAPGARTRLLLSRWLWRVLLGAGAYDDRTLRRRGVKVVGEDEEGSLQRLLGLVRDEPPRSFELPSKFDARSADSRLTMLTLAHRQPRDLETGEVIAVAALLQDLGRHAFVPILSGRDRDLEWAKSPANRLIQKPSGNTVVKALHQRISNHGIDDEVLASHAIDSTAAEHLRQGEMRELLARRAVALAEEVQRFGDRMAAWEHSNRPSVAYLLEEAGAPL